MSLDDLTPEQRQARLNSLAEAGRALAKYNEKKPLTEEQIAKRAYWAARREEEEAIAAATAQRCERWEREGVARGGIRGIMWCAVNRAPVPTWPEYLHWLAEAEKAKMPFQQLWEMICAAGVIKREAGRR